MPGIHWSLLVITVYNYELTVSSCLRRVYMYVILDYVWSLGHPRADARDVCASKNVNSETNCFVYSLWKKLFVVVANFISIKCILK